MTTRDKLIEIFEDTLNMIQENAALKKAVEVSGEGAKLYMEGEPVEISPCAAGESCDCLAAEGTPSENSGEKNASADAAVSVSRHRTFEAAQKLKAKFPGKRIAVLNFASATSPGGGVTDGAFAQEECLCRCSTLYPVLTRPEFVKNYYRFHRKRSDHLYTDACIYVPNVAIIKSDVEEPKRLPKKDWTMVDVITCAAPNLWFAPWILSEEELFELHLKRGEKIIQVALANKAEILVLGAFGCGAFRNDPRVVAKAYRQLVEKYRNRFVDIEFAVYCNQYSLANYEAFKNTMV